MASASMRKVLVVTDRFRAPNLVGTDAKGEPLWSKEVAERGAVFSHKGRCYRSGITYNAGLKRYLWVQIMPGTARWAGPALLGRPVDITFASDNARLGAALLDRYLTDFADPKLALAAYYQGEMGTRKYGVYPSSQHYVDGIWALRNLLQAQNGVL